MNWKTLSIQEIEQRYNQALYAPNAREVVRWYTEESQRVEAELKGERFQYGQGQSEYGYWFKPDEPDRDMVVFIHGGAWKDGLAQDYTFPAKWLTRHGLNYVCLNFDNAPATGGRLFPMLNQLIAALSWISHHYARFGAQAKIHLVSHSSGSHLAACLAGLDWPTLLPHAPRLVQSVLLCSGIYDLEPVAYSKRREYLKLELLEVFALSPIRHAVNRELKMLVVRGELESPEFVRQHDEYVSKLQNEGMDPRVLVGPGLNHFEILTTFATSDGLMSKAFTELIDA